jgi:hypothetical protein
MAGKIFINYRRGDDPGATGRLFDRLQETFETGRLFMDVDNIAPGLDFVRELEEQVAKCDVLLAVIGRGWIDAGDATGARRLDNPDDFVRIEIESALKQDKRVIPVLVGEARMPRPEELPETMRPLARRNAVRLTHERFRADAQGLIKALQQALDDVEALRQKQAEALRQAKLEEERKREEEAEKARAHARREVEEQARRDSAKHLGEPAARTSTSAREPQSSARLATKASNAGRVNRLVGWALICVGLITWIYYTVYYVAFVQWSQVTDAGFFVLFIFNYSLQSAFALASMGVGYGLVVLQGWARPAALVLAIAGMLDEIYILVSTIPALSGFSAVNLFIYITLGRLMHIGAYSLVLILWRRIRRADEAIE